MPGPRLYHPEPFTPARPEGTPGDGMDSGAAARSRYRNGSASPAVGLRFPARRTCDRRRSATCSAKSMSAALRPFRFRDRAARCRRHMPDGGGGTTSILEVHHVRRCSPRRVRSGVERRIPSLAANDMITLYAFGSVFPAAAARRRTSGRSGRSRRLACRTGSTRSTMPAASSTATPTVESAPFARCRSSTTTASWWPSRPPSCPLAEKGGKLIPGDVRQGRTRVVQWCFAAASTVEPTLVSLDLIEIFDSGDAADEIKAELRKIATRWLRRRRAAPRRPASGSPARRFHGGRHHDGLRPARHPQDRPDGSLPGSQGLLRALPGPPRPGSALSPSTPSESV